MVEKKVLKLKWKGKIKKVTHQKLAGISNWNIEIIG